MTLKVPDELLAIDVGVIIGRFQVHKLHDAHRDLIQTVKDRHKKTIILLGLSPTKVTRRNPLDFQCRVQMIHEVFPDIDDIYYINDNPSDAAWSKEVDKVLGQHIAGERTAVIYGSRDSFIGHYKGRYKTCELLPDRIISGTELRSVVANKRRANEDFRAGVIYAVEQQYSHVWPTIDVAILNEENDKILLGRKNIDGNLYRFPGGFVKPTLPNLEANVRSETSEETHLDITDPMYVGSAIINDWRYRGEENKILTMFFAAKKLSGAAQADDDLDELRWFDLSELVKTDAVGIVENHRVLFKMLVEWLATHKV